VATASIPVGTATPSQNTLRVPIVSVYAKIEIEANKIDRTNITARASQEGFALIAQIAAATAAVAMSKRRIEN
jgi:hypothetical protein